MEEKVWVVVHRTCDGVIDAEVFENQADAQSFYLDSAETKAISCSSENTVLIETSVRRRESPVSDDDAWGIPMLGLDSEYVEGLLEEISPGTEIAAAKQILEEKRGKIEKAAKERLHDLLCTELQCGLAEMED